VRIVNLVFREMGVALRRGEYVEFPFGYVKAEKRVSQRWQAMGDEPMRPYFIEFVVDEQGERLFEGGQLPAWPAGWSQKADRSSLGFIGQRRRTLRAAAPARGRDILRTGK
jgi:hypothetical protein